MKSRTSFFNGAVFRKDLTRFAPLWGLYTLCLLLGMFLVMDSNLEYWFAANLGTLCSGMAVINCGYALLTAQILFGDLYSSRMCNAMHAMPLRRECWFTTHVFAGLFFSLVPTAIMAAAAEPFILTMSSMEQGWQIPLYFLLASNLEYLFFFGVAVFSVLCTGNRVGMAVIYALVNFVSYLAYFLTDTLVTPMYYGAITSRDIFLLLCPVVWISGHPLIESERHKVFERVSHLGDDVYQVYGTFKLTEHWTYLFAVAAIGAILLLLARLLYRRRKLECAGDFLASKKLEPVFMVVFSVTCGAIFQFVQAVFVGSASELPVFLAVGVVVGWFAGRMLLERQTRVFGRGRTWLGLVLLLAVLGGGLYGFSLDPFGVEDWVPQPEEVRSVTISMGYRGEVKVEDPEEIADILSVHRGILTEKVTGADVDSEWQQAYERTVELPEVQSGRLAKYDATEKLDYRRYTMVRLVYRLTNGWTVSREYYMWVDTDHGQLAKQYFSRIDGVFYHYMDIKTAEDLMALVKKPENLYVDYFMVPEEFLSADVVEGLFQAILADCQAGTLSQSSSYHEGFLVDTKDYLRKEIHIDLDFADESLTLDIYADSENCRAWLEETGLWDWYGQQLGTSYRG